MDASQFFEIIRTGRMSEATFDSLLTKFIDRPVAGMSEQELMEHITVSQSATEILLNEIERRGLLTFTEDGAPYVPYIAPDSRATESILTRDQT